MQAVEKELKQNQIEVVLPNQSGTSGGSATNGNPAAAANGSGPVPAVGPIGDGAELSSYKDASRKDRETPTGTFSLNFL